ncbi:CGNR zinc finger domain-containing protein [Streptomyces sp. GC420]|uniref:CGNR zinc finger domain-containing protein n=1 Tax=Streptomyces sp. GC420 TaxID=2697568 RepID=UPI001414E546|nr:CGNR zinc finger domain-containing protein [Streptomyces sp. GC420]NBM19073.1 hypothetical protein [Streptomyces sp. GC420]
MSTERAPAPGGLALVEALVNTLDIASGADALDTPEGRAELGMTEADVGVARELREALRAACRAHAGEDMPERARADLGRLLSAAPLRLEFDTGGAASLRPAGPESLAARIALAVATAVADGTWSRLKACESETCRWAYYDRSPAGRSRWCTMSVCGSRAKMRAYRARRTGKG